MDAWVRAVLIVVASSVGTSGFWAYITSKSTRGNATTRLMMGLAYTQLCTLGVAYINRGSITKDEFEDYRKYFFEPYKALGGNGVAERIMRDVTNLPFRSHHEHAEIFQNRQSEGFVNNVRLVYPHGQEAPAE